MQPENTTATIDQIRAECEAHYNQQLKKIKDEAHKSQIEEARHQVTFSIFIAIVVITTAILDVVRYQSLASIIAAAVMIIAAGIMIAVAFIGWRWYRNLTGRAHRGEPYPLNRVNRWNHTAKHAATATHTDR